MLDRDADLCQLPIKLTFILRQWMFVWAADVECTHISGLSPEQLLSPFFGVQIAAQGSCRMPNATDLEALTHLVVVHLNISLQGS